MTPDREKIEAAHRDCEPFLQMTDDMKSSPPCGAEVLGYVVWKHRETIDRLLAEALEAQMAGGWRPIDEETPQDGFLEFKYNTDQHFIGRFLKFSKDKGKIYGADVRPYGNSDCGCGVDYEFVTHYRIPPQEG